MAQVKDYLIQFKEELEFILSSISEENLSQDFVDRLNSLGANIEKTTEDMDEQFQYTNNNALTVSDVINSTAFDLAVKGKMPTFSVNFDTGYLEYK